MKKDALMIISCLGLLSLAACGSSNDGSNVPDFVYQEIALASSSYKMRAQENEKISKINGETMVENVFQYDVTNVRGDKPAIQKTISQTTSSGFSSSSFSYIKGERGYISEETLDYKNEVVEMEALDEDGNKVIYDHEFANPFSFLTKGDLSAVEGTEGHYRISDDKKQLFARYLFVPGYQIETAELFFAGEKLEKVHLESPSFEITYQDAYTGNYVPSLLQYTVDCHLSELGSAVYPHIEPEKSKDKEREETLGNALKKMGTNYTMVVNTHYKDEEPNVDYDTYWYFNGSDAVYHQQHIDDTSKKFDLYYKKDASKSSDLLYLYDYDETAGEWVYYTPFAAASYNVNPQDYSYFLPKFLEVAPELFTYDAEGDKYVCKNANALPYLGNAFLGGGYKASYFTLGMGDQAEIYLNKDKTQVAKVVVGYNEVDSDGYDVSRSYTMTFLDVGTTRIPSFVEE